MEDIPPATQPRFPKIPRGIFGVILICFSAAIGYLLFTHFASDAALPQSQLANSSLTSTPTPTVVPLTNSTAEETLNQTDTSLQATIDQINVDLKDLNKINTNLDNSNSL
jgi:hypothetical protein